MAEMETLKLELKIMDLDSFSDLVDALGAWAEEASGKPLLSAAEQGLFDAAVRHADPEQSN